MKSVNFKKRKYLFIMIGFMLPLLVSFITFREILFTPGIIQHGDLGYPLDMQNFIPYNSYLWNQWMQSFNHHLPKLWLGIPLSTLLMVLSSETVMKLFPFTILFISGVSMYFSIPLLLKKWEYGLKILAASSVSSLLFMINPWTLHMIHHMEWLVLGYGILPLSFSLYSKIISEEKVRFFLYFLLVVLLSFAFTQPQAAFYVLIPFVLMLFFQLASKVSKENIFRCLRRSILLLVLLCVINAFWLLPTLYALPFNAELPFKTLSVEEVDALSNQNPITYVLSLYSRQFTRPTDISYSLNNPFLDNFWSICGILISIVAFSSLVVGSKKTSKKLFLYFGLLSIISISLSMGTNGLLGNLYYSLVSGSLGWIFRDPSRNIGLVVFSLSSLLGLGTYQILSHKFHLPISISLNLNLFKRKLVITGRIFLVFLILTLIFLHGWPALTGNFNNGFVSAEPPLEYQETLNLGGNDPYARIYWQPLDLRYSWDPTLHIGKNIGAISSYNSIFGYDLSVLNQYFYFELLEYNKTNNFGKYLAPLNVKYVVWHRDLISPYKEIAESKINSLFFQKDLSLVSDGNALVVLKNDQNLSPIFIPKEIYLIDGGLDFYNKLISLPIFNSQETGIIFSAYKPLFPQQNEFEDISTIVRGAETTLNDIALIFVDPQEIIRPYVYAPHGYQALASSWCRESSLTWHKNIALPNDIHSWDFDFLQGIIATTKTGAELEIPIEVKEDGTNDLYIRYLKNQKGVEMEVLIDGEKSNTLDCYSESNNFVFEKVGSKYLTAGKHIITLRNIAGLSIVNFLTLTPADEMIKKLTSAENLSSNIKDLILLNVGINKDINFTAIKDSTYKISFYPTTSLQNLKLLVDEREVDVSDSLELEGGEHTLRIEPSVEDYILTKCESLDGWYAKQPGYIRLSEDNVEGNYSIEADPKAYMTYTLPEAINFTEYEYLSAHISETTSEKIILSLIDENGKESAPIEFQSTEVWTQFTFDMNQFNNSECDLTRVKELKFSNIYGDYVIYLDDIRLGKSIPEVETAMIYSTENQPENLQEESPAEVAEYTKVNPTFWKVSVNATAPFMLSFAETYDPLWVAYVNGQKVNSIPLYSVINGFWINQTGPLEITIEYEPQKWFYYGSIISATTLIACATYLTYRWTKKGLWKQIKALITRTRLKLHLNKRKKNIET